MPALITRHFRIHNAIQFFESFTEEQPTRYYFFIGKSYSYANSVPLTATVKTTSGSNTVIGAGTLFTTELAVGDRIAITGQSNVHVIHSIPTAQTFITTSSNYDTITAGANVYIRKLFNEFNPPTPTDSYQDTYYDIWRNMMSLKRVQVSDRTHVITNNTWANNTFYYQYDDLDASLETKAFYVYTSDRNVYKCIDNNNAANSTHMPSTTTTTIEETTDGYRWKYMYTVSSGELLKFVTADFIPVKTLTANDGSAQWSVQQNASNGAINHIKVIANGSNYLYTTNTFVSISNSTLLTIGDNASGDDGVYVGSCIFISSGQGSGQLRKIVKYFGANNTLTVNNAFSTSPNTSSTYYISPTVTIYGDSGLTTNSRATAYVSNAYAGQVRSITMINQGRSYSTANVVISANSSYGLGATARPIISPLGGHGSNPVDELYGTSVMMNIKTINSESNTFVTNNDFRIIGVVRDPKLANGSYANTSVIDQTHRITISSAIGDFFADELIIGQTTGAKGRLVYFANTNAARTAGVLKLIRVTTNGLGEGFAVGEPVVGGTSNATATVVTNTRPALKPFSGIVIYNENREPISRSPVQTEDFKITVRY
jgi:hypothetical protein